MQKPLIIQGDKSILLDVHSDETKEARYALIPFAELEKSPEHLHTYRLTNISLWNAASAGLKSDEVISILKKYSRYTFPENVGLWITETMNVYGMIHLVSTDKPDVLKLVVDSEKIFLQIASYKQIQKYLSKAETAQTFLLKLIHRGTVKQLLLKQNFPVQDEVPLREISGSAAVHRTAGSGLENDIQAPARSRHSREYTPPLRWLPVFPHRRHRSAAGRQRTYCRR